LTEALVERGHDLTLFCAPGSVSSAKVVTLLESTHADEIERSLYEVDHVARALELIDEGEFDVIHDHCGFTTLAMADRVRTPIVHTLHGQFTDATSSFYAHHAHKAQVVAISHAQLRMGPSMEATVIPNPLDLRNWSVSTHKEDYLLWIGRFTPEKGPQRAISAAARAQTPLILAGVIQSGYEEFFAREIQPLIDGVSVRFVGEVGGSLKHHLFAHARALLMPIRWDEPFGMVIIEALACGTPVISFIEGAASELIVEGETGFLVEDETAMAAAVGRLAEIAPADCRQWVRVHCHAEVVAAAYEQVYARAINARQMV
jgi:glycosyltransferase involved in cell wall biosynthesis